MTGECSALEPEDARMIAEDLWEAAVEADVKNAKS
jgi:hypothetical protein